MVSELHAKSDEPRKGGGGVGLGIEMIRISYIVQSFFFLSVSVF